MGNPLNRLRIGLRGRRRDCLYGRLAGRPYGRLRLRLVGRRRNHPDNDLQDDLWNDLPDNPWDELRDREASLGPRHGSRAVAWAVLGAVCRSLLRASVMSLVGFIGSSSAGFSTRSCPRSSVSFAHGVVPSPLDSLPDRSLAMLLDVPRAGVLVCSRPRFRSGRRYGCATDRGASRDAGSMTGSGCRCRFGPRASPDGCSVLVGRRDYDERLGEGTAARGDVCQRCASDRPEIVLLAALYGFGADRLEFHVLGGDLRH